MSRVRLPWLVFAAALGARLPLWWSMSRQPDSLTRPDTATYAEPARHLSRGEGFLSQGRPELSRTPGYPAFLAAHELLGLDRPAAVALTQVVLDAGTAALVALAAGLVGAHPAAWALGLLYAFDPVAAAHAPLLLTETLFTFLLALCVLLLLRGGAAAPGLCLGAATLVRPITLYLWLPWSLALAASLKGRARRAALVFAAAAALLPALWCARNRAVAGHFEYSTITGVNALSWEAASVRAALDGTSLEDGRRKVAEEFSRRYPDPVADPFEVSRLRRRLARVIVLSHLGQTARLHLVSTVKMLFGPGLDLVAQALSPGEPLPSEESLVYSVAGAGTFAVLKARPHLWGVLVTTGLVLTLCYGLGAFGALRLWRLGRRFESAVLLSPLAYLLLLSGGGWSYYRFRIPLMPLLAILSAGALEKKRR